MPGADATTRAIRAVVRGRVQGVGFRAATVARAHELGVLGWVRNDEPEAVLVHAEGPVTAIARFEDFLRIGPPGAQVRELELNDASVEGHEQFAIRGIGAGGFRVVEHDGGRGYLLSLEVHGTARRWLVPKQPSMDPAVKRMALELAEDGPDASSPAVETQEPTVETQEPAVETQEPAVETQEPAVETQEPAVETQEESWVVWDEGSYEQGGRVPWPRALDRGHAVFVLHGSKLRGGFALQRTRPGPAAQWLLIKRRDEQAAR